MATNKHVLRITGGEWSAQKSRGRAALIDGHPHVVIDNAFSGEPEYHPVVILQSVSPAQRGWLGFREARRDAVARGQRVQADGA